MFTPCHYPHLCRMREPNLHIVWTPTSDVLFPLTPALSLGEREHSAALLENSLPITTRLPFGIRRSITSCPLSPRERVRVRGNNTFEVGVRSMCRFRLPHHLRRLKVLTEWCVELASSPRFRTDQFTWTDAMESPMYCHNRRRGSSSKSSGSRWAKATWL